LNDNIASGCELAHDGKTLWRRHIERDRSLSAIARLKECRDPVDGDPYPASEVPKTWALHFDDVSTLISQQRSGIRPSKRSRNVKDPNSI
jgi:hypothetical protein